jgi:thiazole tautomerase (transcriptional regulator TenI)
MSLPVIHVVTADDILARDDFAGRAAEVMWALGARGAIHLRSSTASGRRLYDLAIALVPFQKTTGAWVVVNDRLDVALASGAAGIQLTSRSLSPPEAMRSIRAISPGTPIPAVGASVHTVDDARAATAERDVAWLVAGHVFDTPSHHGEPGRGLSFLADVCAAGTVPVIAIGGVHPERIATLLAHGAYGVAVIRGIWRADDAAAAAREYLSSYDAARDTSTSGRTADDAGSLDPAGSGPP